MGNRQIDPDPDQDQNASGGDIFAVGDHPHLEPVEIFAHILDQVGISLAFVRIVLVLHQQFTVILQRGSRLLFPFLHLFV